MTPPRSAKVDLIFGSTVDSIYKQLRTQGIKIPYHLSGRLEHLQSDHDAISRLHVRAFLTDAELRKLHKKLLTAIGDLLDTVDKEPVGSDL